MGRRARPWSGSLLGAGIAAAVMSGCGSVQAGDVAIDKPPAVAPGPDARLVQELPLGASSVDAAEAVGAPEIGGHIRLPAGFKADSPRAIKVTYVDQPDAARLARRARRPTGTRPSTTPEEQEEVKRHTRTLDGSSFRYARPGAFVSDREGNRQPETFAVTVTPGDNYRPDLLVVHIEQGPGIEQISVRGGKTAVLFADEVDHLSVAWQERSGRSVFVSTTNLDRSLLLSVVESLEIG